MEKGNRDGKTRGIDKTFGIEGRVAEEKKEESSKNVTLAEIKYQENNNDNPSEGENNPRRHTLWLWQRVCLALE